MANNFKPWVDSPTAGQQVQSASVFATDAQRVDGFKAGDPASALRVNSALRQANIVVAGLMQMCDDIKTLPDGLSLMSTVAQVKNAIKAAIDRLDATVLASAKSYTDTREGVINGKLTDKQTQITSNKNRLDALEPRVDDLEDEVAALSGGGGGGSGGGNSCPVYCFLEASSVTYSREFDGEAFSGNISCKFTIYTTRPENETEINLDSFLEFLSYLNDIGTTYHQTSGFIPCSGAFTCTDGKDLAIILTGMNFGGDSSINFEGVLNDLTDSANIGASDRTRMVDFDVPVVELTYFVGVPVPQPPI